MWRWWALGLAACTPTYTNQPTRERDVLVDAFPSGTIVYQDGDGPWQLAPRVGERFGFDVRFQFTWNGYPYSAFYTATLGPRSCTGTCGPRWRSEITEGWVVAGTTIATTISRPDLEALWLWDPGLLLPGNAEWSIAADATVVVSDGGGETHFVAGKIGNLAP